MHLITRPITSLAKAGKKLLWTQIATALLCIVVISVVLPGQNRDVQAKPSASMQEKETRQRLREHGWWPTRGDAARQEYVGSAACAVCHASESASQAATSMAHAAERAADSSVLRATPLLSSQPHTDPSPYQTTISRESHGSEYDVTRGGYAMRGELIWALGAGTMGQTYIVQSSGTFYEGHRTYFVEIKGLDQTPGQFDKLSESLEEAFGRPLSPEDAAACFACHTMHSSLKGQFDPSRAVAGIGCEACHGPGAKHVRAMQNNQTEEGMRAIFTPSSLSPVERNDFCGACHRAPLDVAAIKAFLPINVRFQPYRLSHSRCWSKPDARLTCVACHNPHEEVSRDASFYDARCLACHRSRDAEAVSATATLPACKVADHQCTSCHMPKYRVPSMHGSFTDHDIRIVREGEQFPL
jgi:hypothetical protein